MPQTLLPSLSLLKSVSFYKSYHSNKENKLIHLICIPIIAFTGFIFFSYTGPVFSAYPSIDLPPILSTFFETKTLTLNWNVLVAAIYMSYYCILEQPAGIMAAIIMGVFASSAHTITRLYPDAYLYATPIHIFAWLAQFYGHAVHEKRSPALVDNLSQALLTAPIFVFLDLLYSFGYKKQFQDEIKKEVKKLQDGFAKKK